METYGERVAKLRDELGWTQEQLAEHTGIPLRTLQDIESGKVAKPQRRTRERIDAAFGALRPGQAVSERTEFVNAFLDLLGTWLMAIPEDARTAYVHGEIERIGRWNQ